MSTQKIAPTLRCDGAPACPVLVARIGRETGNQYLGSGLQRAVLHLVVVDKSRLGIETVGPDLVVAARKTGRVAVGQVTALCQVHTHYRVARIRQCQANSRIGLGARMRLDIGVVTVEQVLGSLDGQALGHDHIFATAVVALPRISFCIAITNGLA